MNDVSRRVLQFYVDAAQRLRLDADALWGDLPTVRAALDGQRWYDWRDHVTLLERFERAVGGPDAAEQLALEEHARPSMSHYQAIAQRFITPRTMYRVGLGWFAHLHYRRIDFSCAELSPNVFEVRIVLPEGRSAPALFFRMWRAALRSSTQMLGLPAAGVDASWTEREGVYRVNLPARRGLLSELRQRLQGFLGPETLVRQLERHQADERAALEALIEARENEHRLSQELQASAEFVGLGRAVTTIVHELANPLTSLTSSFELAVRQLERGHPTDAQETMSSARDSVVHLRDVLQMLRTTYGPTSTDSSAVDVASALSKALRFASSQLAAVAYVEQTTIEPLPPVRANPARLTQVFLNLLLNAAQAFPASDPANRIGVTVRQVGDEVVVEISDNGPGLPAAILENPRREITTKPGGTGLGLRICERLTAEMGGSLELQSAPGAGTTARLKFRRSTELTADAVRTPRARLQPKDKRVLIVDDQPNFVVTTKLLLEGCSVDAAGTVEAALQKLQKDAFDVILLDIGLPQHDGLSLYETLYREQPGVAKRVILVTGGLVDATSRARVDRSGVKCLLKPFTQDELFQAITDLGRAPPA